MCRSSKRTCSKITASAASKSARSPAALCAFHMHLHTQIQPPVTYSTYCARVRTIFATEQSLVSSERIGSDRIRAVLRDLADRRGAQLSSALLCICIALPFTYFRCECRRTRRARVCTGSSRPTRTTSALASTSSGRSSPAIASLCRRPTRRTRATRTARTSRLLPKRAANRPPPPLHPLPPSQPCSDLKVRTTVLYILLYCTVLYRHNNAPRALHISFT